LPAIPNWSVEDFILKFNAKKVKPEFSYNSKNNSDWETIESLKELIEINLNSKNE